MIEFEVELRPCVTCSVSSHGFFSNLVAHLGAWPWLEPLHLAIENMRHLRLS